MKKKICMILIAVFVAVLGTSTYFIIDHYKESNKQAALYNTDSKAAPQRFLPGSFCRLYVHDRPGKRQ